MADRARADDLFGHPRGLTVLSTTEMWERFSFYGMQALLMLYMTKHLLQPGVAPDVLGLAAFRSALTGLFGPMTDLAFASQTYGIYSGLIYGTPLLGAWLGDRVLGKTRTVALGCVLMTLGHSLMAVERFFLVALLLIVLGAGGVIGNMAAQVGLLYDQDDHRRTRAFGIYLITLNIGALAAPLAIGTLGEKVGWHYGFAIAGVGMAIGLVTYLVGRRHLPPDTLRAKSARPKLNPAERRRVLALLALLVPYTLYSAAAQQAYGIMFVWADTAVDRTVLGWQVPVTWIGIVDGILTIFGVWSAARIWDRLAARNREPGDVTKIGIGFFLVAAAFLFAAAIALLPLVPVLAWVFFYCLLDLGVGWVEPPLQSTVSRDSPVSVNATMMSVMKATGMLAYFFLGWFGRFYEPLGPSLYWVAVAAQSLLALVLLAVFRRPLLRLLEPAGGPDWDGDAVTA